MKAKIGVALVHVVCFVLFFAGCAKSGESDSPSGPEAGQTITDSAPPMPAPAYTTIEADYEGVPTREAESHAYVIRLLAKAEKLAKGEMARMAAASLIYRGVVEHHRRQLVVMNALDGIFVKLYRNYTDYEIVDIRRSSSLLNPVSIEIQYRYDLMGTSPRPDSDPMAAQLAAQSRDYHSLGKYQFSRIYLCDEQGDLVGESPALPERLMYFARKDKALGSDEAAASTRPGIAGFSLEQIREKLKGVEIVQLGLSPP